jgi:hypothetical protein
VSKLFKVTLVSKSYIKTPLHPIYCIANNKDDCAEKINSKLKSDFSIKKIYFLGDALSGILYRKSK